MNNIETSANVSLQHFNEMLEETRSATGDWPIHITIIHCGTITLLKINTVYIAQHTCHTYYYHNYFQNAINL